MGTGYSCFAAGGSFCPFGPIQETVMVLGWVLVIGLGCYLLLEVLQGVIALLPRKKKVIWQRMYGQKQ